MILEDDQMSDNEETDELGTEDLGQKGKVNVSAQLPIRFCIFR